MPNGAALLVRALEAAGVEVIFGYPGGATLALYDALLDTSIRHILCRHEQAAAHAADGYARVTGKVGVCLSTSGPGATNLVTGLLNASMDSIPVLALTGQVGTAALGTDAFQEADTLSIAVPVTKACLQIRRVEDIRPHVAEAFRLAVSDRPGPVLLDFPKDVLAAKVEEDALPLAPAAPVPVAPDPGEIRALADAIRQAERPLFLVGAGASDAADDVRALVGGLDAASTATLLGLGVIPWGFPGYLGMVGMHGTVASNRATLEADLLVGIGARFDDRVTGNVNRFAPRARIAHIDIDAAQIGKVCRVDFPVHADAREAVRALAAELAGHRSGHGWTEAPTLPPPSPPVGPDEGIPVDEAFAAIRDVLEEPYRIVTDVGQHQMWAALHLPITRPRTFLSSGGLGTMGYGLPAAVGAQVGAPDDEIWLVSGDGGFVMTGYELATLREENLPVRVLILDNRGLGMVRQWQTLFYQERYSGVDLSPHVPDFRLLAQAYGIPGHAPRDARELRAALRDAHATRGPVLVHIPIPKFEAVYPMIPAGTSAHEMITGPREGVKHG